MAASIESPSDFDVVLLGTDIGVYAYARAFYALYGVRSTVIARVAAGPIRRSKIVDVVEIGKSAQRHDTLSALEHLGHQKRRIGRPTLLLSNGDTFSTMFSEKSDWLSQWYVVPALTPDVLEAAGNKIAFSKMCKELGIQTPRMEEQDFSNSDSAKWEPREIDLPFPVIAKPAKGAAYEGLHFPGKRKVYKLDSQVDLRATFLRVRDAGFRDSFVIQELIPGGDSAMRSVTTYVDSSSEVTLLASAHVLLQEHHPLTIGNPAAMATTYYPDILVQAEKLLAHLGYHGFANFDVKIDPRDGVPKFFEVNPRVGRNNYYVTAAGANIAQFVVADLVEGRRLTRTTVQNEVLYSLVPMWLLRRYLTAEERRLAVRAARNGLHHPFDNSDTLYRRIYMHASKANYVRKYAKYYPHQTPTGF